MDNNTEIFAGTVKGQLLIKLENQIISDIDYLSANEMLLTMHDTGKVLLFNTLNNSTTEWIDLSSIVLTPGTQESGLQNRNRQLWRRCLFLIPVKQIALLFKFINNMV